MAVEQHLHRFRLEFFGVDAALSFVLAFVGSHGSLLGCLVRVTLRSRSVHKSPYTSGITYHQYVTELTFLLFLRATGQNHWHRA